MKATCEEYFSDEQVKTLKEINDVNNLSVTKSCVSFEIIKRPGEDDSVIMQREERICKEIENILSDKKLYWYK